MITICFVANGVMSSYVMRFDFGVYSLKCQINGRALVNRKVGKSF